MILQGYSVLDKAVGAFLPVFWARSKGEALRMFLQACKDEKSQFAAQASDYVLYKLGDFDDNSGMFTSVEPERLLSALEALGPDTAKTPS